MLLRQEDPLKQHLGLKMVHPSADDGSKLPAQLSNTDIIYIYCIKDIVSSLSVGVVNSGRLPRAVVPALLPTNARLEMVSRAQL